MGSVQPIIVSYSELDTENEDDTDCPYWQSQNGGPNDLPGAHGPGTCNKGCYSEPRCMV